MKSRDLSYALNGALIIASIVQIVRLCNGDLEPFGDFTITFSIFSILIYIFGNNYKISKLENDIKILENEIKNIKENLYEK